MGAEDDRGTVVVSANGQPPGVTEKYLGEPRAKRSGMAICLSGGGFRAALFHLGALRRLNELGILSQTTTISCVSGGSIIGAHLADRVESWPPPGEQIPDWETRVAQPFREFTSKNLRTAPILKRLVPWNWLRSSTGVRALADAYHKRLTQRLLKDLPPTPEFIFCATDMAYGVNWEFSRRRMGDYQAGYMRPPPDTWRVATSVAASSCFPPIFNPLPIDPKQITLTGGKAPAGPERDRIVSGLRLTDGGNYDNLGLEPVWKDHAVVFVSDGGATFDFSADKNLIWRLSRYMAIQGRQALAVRKRWLIASYIEKVYDGAYWGNGTPIERYGSNAPEGYSEELVKKCIAEVRTDMDAFSEGEVCVLENHGYLLAEAAVRTHVRELILKLSPLSVPHPHWMDEDRVWSALANSNKRKFPFGRY